MMDTKVSVISVLSEPRVVTNAHFETSFWILDLII